MKIITWQFFKSETDITRPMFDGTGYLSFPISETKSIRHLTSFSLELKTEATDGMVLWIGEVNFVKQVISLYSLWNIQPKCTSRF